MRSPPTLAIAVLVVAAVFSTITQAQENSWCAFFSDGHTECGFATLQGCMAAIYDKTGLCDHKPQVVSPHTSDASSANRRQHHRDGLQ
jgi:hypothetical protein